MSASSAWLAFRSEIQAVHEQYTREFGGTPRFARILELPVPEEAIEAALYQPSPRAYLAWKHLFDRAQAAGRALRDAIAGGAA